MTFVNYKRSQFETEAIKNFPIICRNMYGDLRQSCMSFGFDSFGFDIEPGWYNIFWELCEKLEKIAQKQPPPKKHNFICKIFLWPLTDKFAQFLRRKKLTNIKPKFLYSLFWGKWYRLVEPPEDNRICFEQVKEKFASLRIYTNYYSDDIQNLIDETSAKSEITCEKCGKPGNIRGECWLITLCDDCDGWKR